MVNITLFFPKKQFHGESNAYIANQTLEILLISYPCWWAYILYHCRFFFNIMSSLLGALSKREYNQPEWWWWWWWCIWSWFPAEEINTKWSPLVPPICKGVAALLAALERLYMFVTPLPCSLVLWSLYIDAAITKRNRYIMKYIGKWFVDPCEFQKKMKSKKVFNCPFER